MTFQYTSLLLRQSEVDWCSLGIYYTYFFLEIAEYGIDIYNEKQ